MIFSHRKLPVSLLNRFIRKFNDVLIRPLTVDDRLELDAMIAQDPVAFLYAAEQLEKIGLPASSALNNYRAPYGFMGIFEPLPGQEADSEISAENQWGSVLKRAGQSLDQLKNQLIGRRVPSTWAPATCIPGTTEELQPQRLAVTPSYRLVGIFWLGSNCVPLIVPPQHRRAVAAVVTRASKHLASIFGAQEDVMPLWEILRSRLGQPLSVRENQPMLVLPKTTNLGKLLRRPLDIGERPLPQLTENVRWARTGDRTSLLKASIAMFTEEIGYDPMTRDPRGYAQRVDDYIRTGRSLVATNADGVVIFKVDIGLAHADICQLQGVWLHPAYRGLGLSETLLAQACELIRPRFPLITLYVNDFNLKALALYQAVGFEQKATFASVLF